MTASPFVIALVAWPLDTSAGFFPHTDGRTIEIALETGDARLAKRSPVRTLR